jgi:Rieske Fe-S protein
MNSRQLKDETVNSVLAVDRESDNEISDEGGVRQAGAGHQVEFPYERDEEAQVTRREFCNFLFLTSSALFVGAAGFAGKAAYTSRLATNYTPVKIEGAETLQQGQALNFFYPKENDTAILIRTRDGSYRAFGQKCTHLTCPVYYAKENDRLECPCHEGGFDAKTGAVLYGPPPRPLERVLIEVRENEVWAVGKETNTDETSSHGI